MLIFTRGLIKYIGNIYRVKLYEPHTQEYFEHIEHLERIIDYHSKSNLSIIHIHQYFELKNKFTKGTKNFFN